MNALNWPLSGLFFVDVSMSIVTVITAVCSTSTSTFAFAFAFAFAHNCDCELLRVTTFVIDILFETTAKLLALNPLFSPPLRGGHALVLFV